MLRGVDYRPNPIREPQRVTLSGTVRDTRGFVVRGAGEGPDPARPVLGSVGEVRSRRDGRFSVALRPTPAFEARGDEIWAYVRARKPGGKPDDRSTGVRLVRLTVR